MPGKRRQRIQKERKKSQKTGSLLYVLIILIVGLFGYLFFRVNTKIWNGTDKVSFVTPEKNGDVKVTVLDPSLSEIATLIIPGDTQVDVARGYGTLRIKNVWQLGINEKLSGLLLAQTVTGDFLFPTRFYSESDLGDMRKFIFTPGKTNILIGDRVAMALFALKVKSIDRTEIDLGKSQFLKKQTLIDGQPGYVQSGPISGRLTIYFSDNKFAEGATSGKNLKFSIVDLTDRPGKADLVGQILEILGGKIVNIDRRTPDPNFGCEVYGKNKDAVTKIADLFSCKVVNLATESDAEIKIGGAFVKTF